MNRGFSLLEILVVVAISLTLLTLLIISFSSLRENRAFYNEIERIAVLIDEARFKTIGSKNFSTHGIHFETDRAVLFEGDFFSSADPSNKIFIISDLVKISSINLNGGGSEIIFQKITGETDQYGVITISVKNDPSESKDIEVNKAGISSI